MHPLSSTRGRKLAYLLCALCLLMAPRNSYSQEAPDLPKIGDLKVGSYQKIARPSQVNVPSYTDLMQTISQATAYARGHRLLPSYREPVVTRGASGIAVFRSVSPSVVLVIVGKVTEDDFDPEGLGAGVLLNASGDILTNWHVIKGYPGALIFLKPQGSSELEDANAYGARVIAQDEVADLALLRIVKPPSDLHPVAIGTIASVQVAEDIHIIGHPKGKVWSYSTGVVSQVRDPYDWTYEDGSKHESKVLQLQTAINPGNSGGPVLDDQGRLLGLIAMSEEGQNLDYAIAVDAVQKFLSSAATLSTRGRAAEPKSPNAEYSAGSLVDGRKSGFFFSRHRWTT
jgi:S1-C subfamily serine protease